MTAGAGPRAGIAAGLAGFAVFLILHAIWIVPIWTIAPVGGLIAAGIGAVVGEAYDLLAPHDARRPLLFAGVFVVAAATLLPAIILAELGARAGVAPLAGILAALFGSAALAGAAIGRSVGKSRRAAGMCLVSALLLAAGPGHNVPMLAATAAVPLELLLLGSVFCVSAAVLVWGRSLLRRRAATGQSARSGLGAAVSMR